MGFQANFEGNQPIQVSNGYCKRLRNHVMAVLSLKISFLILEMLQLPFPGTITVNTPCSLWGGQTIYEIWTSCARLKIQERGAGKARRLGLV